MLFLYGPIFDLIKAAIDLLFAPVDAIVSEMLANFSLTSVASTVGQITDGVTPVLVGVRDLSAIVPVPLLSVLALFLLTLLVVVFLKVLRYVKQLIPFN
jgi:hypothetical protein